MTFLCVCAVWGVRDGELCEPKNGEIVSNFICMCFVEASTDMDNRCRRTGFRASNGYRSSVVKLWAAYDLTWLVSRRKVQPNANDDRKVSRWLVNCSFSS